jgi:hypothetical protein
MQVHHLDTDLLVAGGGLSGVCAALAAARNGARVVLVQNRSVLGGNASSEIRMHIVGADAHGQKPGARETGLMEELRLEDAVRNPQRSYPMWDLLLYEKVLAEPNITLLLDTIVTSAEVEPLEPAAAPRPTDPAAAMQTPGPRRRITAARAVRHGTEDEFMIRAKFYADCTGDGRLGFEAGADFTEGREARCEFDEPLAQPLRDYQRLGSSMMFMARDHGKAMPFHAPDWVRKFTREDFQGHRDVFSYEYGYWWFEWGGQLDTLKDDAAIRHECLRIALGVWDFVKNSGDHPGSANYALDWVAPITGKRESRRFLGPVILTEHDIRNPDTRPDSVAYGGWPMDLHPPSGVDANPDSACSQHWFPHLFSIPFGTYHSRNVENLFFAGRNISATHVAFAATRVMATCGIGGQAVGTAAALLVRSGQSRCDDADPAALRRLLARDDCFLPGYAERDPADLAPLAQITPEHGRVVTDGIARELKTAWGSWADLAPHAWQADGPSGELCLQWPEPVTISEIRIAFDTGLHRELILSGSDRASQKTLRTPQPECVKDYRIRLDGKIVAVVSGNIHRHRIHRLPEPTAARSLVLECLATHGATPPRVFEVRIF